MIHSKCDISIKDQSKDSYGDALRLYEEYINLLSKHGHCKFSLYDDNDIAAFISEVYKPAKAV